MPRVSELKMEDADVSNMNQHTEQTEDDGGNDDAKKKSKTNK